MKIIGLTFAIIMSVGLAYTPPAQAWHPYKTTVIPLAQTEVDTKPKKPRRVVEIRPTKDPVKPRKKTSLASQIGRSAFVSLAVGALVTTAKIGLAMLGAPVF